MASDRGFRWRVDPVQSRRQTVWHHRGTDVRLPVVACFEFPADSRRSGPRLLITLNVHLVAGEPAVTDMSLTAADGLNLQHLQRDFRWATPLRLVLDHLVATDDGTDNCYGRWMRPGSGAPLVEPKDLDDDFLEEVARAYLAAGTRYSRELGDKYGVAPRSVIRWVDLARQRGILTRPDRVGAKGGHIVPKSKR